MDKIIIPQIPLRVRVGVTDEERSREQDILIDIELGLDLHPAGTTDDLTQSVDYEVICTTVTSMMRSRFFKLIETIANEVAGMLLEQHNIDEVLVRVRKPDALRIHGVPYAAVEVFRRRNG